MHVYSSYRTTGKVEAKWVAPAGSQATSGTDGPPQHEHLQLTVGTIQLHLGLDHAEARELVHALLECLGECTGDCP